MWKTPNLIVYKVSVMKKAITFILVLTAFTPLVVDSGVLSSFFSPKNFFFRLAVLTVAVLFSLLLIKQKEFSADVHQRLVALFKNKTVLFSILTIVLITISALFFAFDKTLAFWGEGARGEGAMEFLFLGGFFLFCLLFLKERDWKNYFKISLIVAFLLFFIEFYQFTQGMVRPDSLFGNPIFLAAYYLFTITAGLLLLKRRPLGGERAWNYISYAAIIFSVVGIFLTKSRGVLFGMVVGGMALLVFFTLNKETEKKMRRVSAILLGTIIIFGSIFFATRANPLWQKVPGINRVAQFSFSDKTTQARFINTKEAFVAVSPKHEGINRFLFGWGWDNYIFAWQKYYDPALYQYDPSVFDRTHNKFMDLLVMGGLLTLTAFLSGLVFWMRDIFRGTKGRPWITAILIFWFVSYLIENIFAFDTVATYIVFYILVAYAVSMAIERKNENVSKK